MRIMTSLYSWLFVQIRENICHFIYTVRTLQFLSMQENKFKALVLDSGAFINHASITGVAEACSKCCV